MTLWLLAREQGWRREERGKSAVSFIEVEESAMKSQSSVDLRGSASEPVCVRSCRQVRLVILEFYKGVPTLQTGCRGENFLLSHLRFTQILKSPLSGANLKVMTCPILKCHGHATVALVSLSFFLFVLLANITGINIALPKSSFGTGH